MGIAGAGFGASNALEDIIAEQMLRARMAQQQQEQAAQLALQTRRLDQDGAESQARLGLEREKLDLVKADKRQQDNAVGVRRMIGEGITRRVPLDDMQGMAFAEGIDLPQAPVKKTRTVTGIGPKGEPINKVVGEDEAVQEWRAPKEPTAADKPQVFNVGGKLVDGNGNVIYDGGSAGGGPSPYATERAARTSAAVDGIIGDVNGWTAGYGGLLANLPQSEARALRGKLNTLKANIAFNELAAMREASKTGGALGSIAVRELELLENSLGNLDQLQQPSELISELTNIKTISDRWQQAAGGAAKAAPMQPVTSRGGAPAPGGGPRPKLRFDAKGNPKS